MQRYYDYFNKIIKVVILLIFKPIYLKIEGGKACPSVFNYRGGGVKPPYRTPPIKTPCLSSKKLRFYEYFYYCVFCNAYIVYIYNI